MASSAARALGPLLRRSVVSARTAQSSLRGGASPPLPPFARSPAPTEKLVENIDAVWDDAVAPELALDYDCQHISSSEGLAWWLGGFGFFFTVYQVIKSTNPEGKNPAVNRKMNIVVENPKVGPPAAPAAE